MRRTPKFPGHRTFNLVWICLAVPLSLGAAPSTAEDPSANPSAQHDAQPSTVSSVRAGDQSSGSRSVDLLIQMQQRSAGLEFNERRPLTDARELRLRPVAMPPGKSSQVPVSEDTKTPASGLFGSGATPMVQSNRSSGGETRVPQSEAPSAGGGRPARGASSAEPMPPWLLLPREVIEYVRENRGFVVACVSGLLLMFWGGSVAFSRRRA